MSTDAYFQAAYAATVREIAATDPGVFIRSGFMEYLRRPRP